MKAVGYVRVSTQRQANEGISVGMQTEKIKQWAALNDAELVGEFADNGISGAKTCNREGLLAALALAKRTKAALVVYSLSRLSRSTKDMIEIAEQLDKAGCDLVVLNEKIDTTTPSGRMVFRMLAAMNEFEREQVSERTKHALASKRAEGFRVSGIAPMGYSIEGDKLKPVASEQDILRTVAELKKQGLSLRKISAELAARGCFNRNGEPFAAKVVRSMANQRKAA